MPPIFLNILKKLFFTKQFSRKNFKSWEEALKNTTSYNTENVFMNHVNYSSCFHEKIHIFVINKLKKLTCSVFVEKGTHRKKTIVVNAFLLKSQ